MLNDCLYILFSNPGPTFDGRNHRASCCNRQENFQRIFKRSSTVLLKGYFWSVFTVIQLRSKFCHTIYSKTPFQFRLEEGFFNEELLKYFLMGFLGWFDSGRFDNQRSPQSSSSLRRSHWRRSIRRHQVRRQGCSKAYSQNL